MKTYKYHGTCVRHMGDAYPVYCGQFMRWAAWRDMNAMLPVGYEAAWSPNPMKDHPEHDRTFTLVSDSKDWGVRTELSRGFPGDWPSIAVFEGEREAREHLARLASQYDNDPRWTRVVRS